MQIQRGYRKTNITSRISKKLIHEVRQANLYKCKVRIIKVAYRDLENKTKGFFRKDYLNTSVVDPESKTKSKRNQKAICAISYTYNQICNVLLIK